MEEDDPVGVAPVVVVDVEEHDREVGGQSQRAHHHGVAEVQLAGCGNAALVEVAEDQAGRDAVCLFQLVPATDRHRVEGEVDNQVVHRQAEAGDGLQLLLGHSAEVGELTVVGHARVHLRAPGGLHHGKDLRKVHGFDVDALVLQSDFVHAHGFECGRAGADGPDIAALKPAHYPAGAGKPPQFLGEGFAQGVKGKLLRQRVADARLAQYVAHGYLAAQRVPAMGEVQLARLVGIGRHQNGYAGVLEGDVGAVLVAEVGQADDHAVVLPPMFLEKIGVAPSLDNGLHRAVAGERFLHHEGSIAAPLHRLDQLGPRRGNQFAGKKAPVAKK